MYYIQVKPRSNSKRYTKTIFKTEDENKMLDYLKERQTIDPIQYRRPYMFSHIEAINTNTDTIQFIVTKREINQSQHLCYQPPHDLSYSSTNSYK